MVVKLSWGKGQRTFTSRTKCFCINSTSAGSHYGDARRGAIEAARTLYGDNSDEVAQTIEAWNAVGVYDDHLLRICGEFDSLSNPRIL